MTVWLQVAACEAGTTKARKPTLLRPQVATCRAGTNKVEVSGQLPGMAVMPATVVNEKWELAGSWVDQ